MTESVSDEYREIVELHDREFQKFSIDNQIYCVPVDEPGIPSWEYGGQDLLERSNRRELRRQQDEEQRLESQHQILRYLFEGRLFFPPIQRPTKILDCGYGRGNWALEMAQTYPDSEVTAIDVYPTNELPDDQPDNLEIEAWDLNQTLTPTYKPNEYDLIHSRLVAPGIKRDRWPRYIRDIVRLLKRGGWVQMAEFYYIIQSDSGLLTDEHALMQWSNGYRHTMEQDRDPRADPRLQWVGQQNLENVGAMLDSLAIWPFTTRMGWTKEQVTALTDRARSEAADPRLKLYIPL
ncbi:hypothetical protein SLS55_003148 [Diplodia seriata]|uniref:S-adenosyl-L-methionine-dependent methyltransferase n=1 Tax=Diplodia seriata TaxID=420778 RepID=A0ABR3CM72_9PEZI